MSLEPEVKRDIFGDPITEGENAPTVPNPTGLQEDPSDVKDEGYTTVKIKVAHLKRLAAVTAKIKCGSLADAVKQKDALDFLLESEKAGIDLASIGVEEDVINFIHAFFN